MIYYWITLHCLYWIYITLFNAIVLLLCVSLIHATGGGIFTKRSLDPEPDEMFKKPKIGATAKFLAEMKSEETSVTKRKLRRTVSKEELSTITSIRCENVPDIINSSDILLQHFSMFGEVVKVVPNTRKKSATVHFTDHAGAKAAKIKGKNVEDFKEVIGNIIYSQASPKRMKRKTPNADSEDSSSIDFPQEAEPRLKKLFKTTKPVMKVASEKSEMQFNASKDASQGELLRIMKQQAVTDEERWKVLDARDKYLKVKYPKTQLRSGLEIEDMNLIGTCPDICPEKER